MSRKYFTPAEVSDRFGGRISVRTLANWRYLGTGPKFSRLGGRILYPVEALDEWERTRTVESTSEYRR
ncbi:hypothetical protein [Bordetella phage vB_BbrM_PHB04]|uniref:Helix-turn-helix domain-containing protein n=1 Tax=Bordetella phage vB_BbrM_PHB04 TaxID=2029657 RepID=A0A291LAT3_9CAUD|nr:DNA-binding protein [Bordetella phage vB_BbrM_PHB04]ATI15727.1 hypothetical protein [Bordetella phage vB_BbrM_PHB04]